MPATIAILGRPNVGKSTLFNRLIGRNQAITHDRPGVTRDPLYGEARLDGRRVALVDTGGLEIGSSEDIQVQVFEQAREAVGEAHGILLVMDGRRGMAPLDHEVLEYVRASGLPSILVVNKVDGEEREAEMLADFWATGMEAIAVSAEHGMNIRALEERIKAELLDRVEAEDEAVPGEEPGLRLAMLGRPNVGKSSLINALLGASRLIVSDEAGTTRDAVAVTFERDEGRYTFVDTAGVRRKARIRDSLERYSVLRALKNSKWADVTVLVLDAAVGVTSQDKKLLDFLVKEKTPFIAAVNKLDLIPRGKRNEVKRFFEQELRIVGHVPLIYTSTVTRAGLGGILPLARRLWAECQVRVGTGELNRAMQAALDRHQPPMVKGRRARFYYLTQVDTTPPRFVFFVNDPDRIKPSYARYLENQLRKLFGLQMAPIHIHFRSSHK
jgi:GTP-binding protein